MGLRDYTSPSYSVRLQANEFSLVTAWPKILGYAGEDSRGKVRPGFSCWKQEWWLCETQQSEVAKIFFRAARLSSLSNSYDRENLLISL